MGRGRTPFVPFGLDHLVAMGLIVMVAGALALWVRRDVKGRAGVAAAWLLTAVTLAAVVGFVVHAHGQGTLDVWVLLPFHLCDMLLIVGVVALHRRWPPVAEVLYYWAAAGTLLAVLSPDVRWAWPHERFTVFFAFHGLVIAMMAVVVFGYRLSPRPGSALRVWLLTNAYAAVVGLVNWLAGTNYLFLASKPRGATLLEWFGPWPVYILVADAVALALFLLLEMPWRRARRG